MTVVLVRDGNCGSNVLQSAKLCRFLALSLRVANCVHRSVRSDRLTFLHTSPGMIDVCRRPRRMRRHTVLAINWPSLLTDSEKDFLSFIDACRGVC